MKILVTGGLGFIGSNFILKTLNEYPEYKITNIDAMLNGSNSNNLKDVHNNKKYGFVKNNIQNQKVIDKLVSQNEIVINFAAESHVDRSISNPRPFIDSNIIGTYTILEAIRKFKKKLIQISTDEVFGSLKKPISADENFRLNPSSPYSSSKASAEILVNSYHVTYDLDIIITRCTNNFGPRQHPEKLIPKVIMLAKENKKIPVYGTGKNIRDWIFVDDHCDALLDILHRGKEGESYNISGSNEVTNNFIIKKILKIMNKSTELMSFVKDRPGHDFRYSLDSTKIKKKLGWRPKHNFEAGIEETIEWYLKNQKWWDMISNPL